MVRASSLQAWQQMLLEGYQSLLGKPKVERDTGGTLVTPCQIMQIYGTQLKFIAKVERYLFISFNDDTSEHLISTFEFY